MLCTGNLSSKSQLEWLSSLAPSVRVTKGDFDADDASLPETDVITVGEFRIGLCHGHTVIPWGDPEALAAMARRLECDILVTGHTHESSVFEVGGKIILNPGSMTGAFSATSAATLPSFQLLSLTGHAATVFTYSLVKGKVTILQSDHTKGGGAAGSSASATAAAGGSA